jgi:hypothetical protein
MLFMRFSTVRFLATRLFVFVANENGTEFTFTNRNPTSFFETIFAFGGGVFAPGNDSSVFVVHEVTLGQTAYGFIRRAMHNLGP